MQSNQQQVLGCNPNTTRAQKIDFIIDHMFIFNPQTKIDILTMVVNSNEDCLLESSNKCDTDIDLDRASNDLVDALFNIVAERRKFLCTKQVY
jgi:hypothetical protein